MIKYSNLFLSTVFISTFAFQAYAKNDITGFRDLKWGSPLTSDFVSQGKLGHVRKSDSTNIGNVQLTGINYKFDSNGLSTVILTTSERSDFDNLILALKAKYGQPDSILSTAPSWKAASGYIIGKYESYPYKIGIIMINSQQASDNEGKSKDEAAKKAIKDL